MQGRISNDWNTRLIVAAAGVLGVSAVMTQLALLRELLAAFAGNELVLGVLLGNWMLLTGLGAFAGRSAKRLRDPVSVLIVALILLALLPPAQVCVVRVFRDVVFVRGAQAGVGETFLASLALLAPYCLVSGVMLAVVCRVLAARGEDRGIGRVYFADTAGCVAGGLLFTFVLVRLFDHVALLCIAALPGLAMAALLALRFRRRLSGGLAVAAAAALVVVASQLDVDGLTTARQFPGQRVLFRGNSPCGRLVVTDVAGQLNFIGNGVPMFSTRNEAHVEETVHYALAQRPGARRVLLVSGGFSGTAKETLKHAGVSCTYVELDPLVVAVATRFLPDHLRDPRITIVQNDGRRFIRETEERFDVVIVDVPDPSTAQLNRFYTAEFFRAVKSVLADGGVLSFGLGQYASYVSPHLARLLACADATLRQEFRHTLMIPGGRIFFLASDGELTTTVAARLAAAGVDTTWMRPAYLDAMLAPDRLADLARAVRRPAEINRDFSPVLYFRHLVHWTSQFSNRWALAAVALAVALAAYVARLRPVPLAIFASGFAASGMELLLLFGFQVLCGSLYHQLGVLVAAFMAGLAAGAHVANRRAAVRRRDLAVLALAVAAGAALLPFLLGALGRAAGTATVVPVATIVLSFILAAVTGMQFPVAARLDRGEAGAVASRLYVADFAGGFLGALVPAVVVLPLLGLGAACWIMAGVNAAAGLVLLLRKGDAT